VKFPEHKRGEIREGDMPVRIRKVGGKYQVSTPNGTKSKGTTLKKAKAQERLLNAVDHGWRPRKKK
jgi:hypothetical protein